MICREIIGRVDALKYNTYTDAEKLEWLQRLEDQIQSQVYDAYEDGEKTAGALTMDSEPSVAKPYDEIYFRWLEAQIDYTNGEYDKYNASIVMYNTAYEAFANHYNKLHMPVQRVRRILF